MVGSRKKMGLCSYEVDVVWEDAYPVMSFDVWGPD